MGKQLLYEPFIETRNRKMLRANRLAQWELRVDRYRIFYQENETEGNINITAVGYKNHGILSIRGKEVKL